MENKINEDIVRNIVADIHLEFKSATSKHPKFNSRHEGYAILDEERFELWLEVMKNHVRDPESKKKMRKEAIQVAAMAMRFIYDCCDTKSPNENW
jgi:gluconate kinase